MSAIITHQKLAQNGLLFPFEQACIHYCFLLLLIWAYDRFFFAFLIVEEWKDGDFYTAKSYILSLLYIYIYIYKIANLSSKNVSV